MKKMMLLGSLVVGAATLAHAQESRQDVSASFIGVYAPNVNGLLVQPMSTTETGGFLGSYRYMVTPRSALEINYSFAQNSIRYHLTSEPNDRVHTRQQEITAAYVYSRTYRNYTPFFEAGVGGMIFTPIQDNGNTFGSDVKQKVQLGALFGGGLAYEISPSFDIRAEYRGFAMKTPDFGLDRLKTSRYYVLMTPSVGVAYHF